MKRIPIAGPSITQSEIDRVAEAAATAWYADAGKYHDRFEAAFAGYLGVRHAVSLPSCTAGLHLALAALDIGEGDEVIVPDITWIATSAPVSYVGATPVFADVDRDTWCISAEGLEACVTSRTKAVIGVDLYGNVPDMEAVNAAARRHGIHVIEDAAEAIGSEQDGQRAGSFGIAGTFSFHGSKTMTTGEGGMLVTDDDAIQHRAVVLRDHGRVPGDRVFWNREIAFKYKMSSLQAALGLAQLERIEELTAKKREIFSWYREELSGVAALSLNCEKPGTTNTYWMVTVLVDPSCGLQKEKLMDILAQEGIDCRPFFYPLSSLPAYRDLPSAREARDRNTVSYEISPYGVNLPSALNLTRDDVVRVCDALKKTLDTAPGHGNAG